MSQISWFFLFEVFSSVVNCLYSFAWDVVLDWGLVEHSGKNWSIRKTRVYPSTLLISNVNIFIFLAFAWKYLKIDNFNFISLTEVVQKNWRTNRKFQMVFFTYLKSYLGIQQEKNISFFCSFTEPRHGYLSALLIWLLKERVEGWYSFGTS